MPNLSNLDGVFFNPGGLWGDDQDGKISKKTVQLGKELRMLYDSRGGGMDYVCITESHLREDNVHEVPEKYLGFSWVHELATQEDKFAGASIGYKWWMPKPVDLLAKIRKEYDQWVKDGRQAGSSFAYQNFNITAGRLQVVVFQLEEMDCVVCNFYGYTSKVPTQKRYNLINLATRLIDDCVVKWSMGMGPGRKISVVWGGDFNHPIQ